MLESNFSKILVVDDVLDNVNVLSTLLRDRGYKVRKVLNGKMALMGVQSSPPDLILLDINMPEMNGYEVCEKLKSDEKTKHIPVIFLSALDDTLDKVKAFEVGGVDYITKPFQFEEVVVRVQTQLSLQSLQKQLQEHNAILNEQNQKLQLSEAKERKKSQQLEQALTQLKETQAKLIHSEKMASLGQLVAGIAHEINNPVSFIYGNLNHVTLYTSHLLKLVQIYQELIGEPPDSVMQFKEQVDFEFLCEDLPALVTSMKIGAERIRDIVLSLRLFSRLDESVLKVVDIHEGLESTLMILQHRLQKTCSKNVISVIKNYGKLPLIECEAGQLNQVFFHLLNNAIDALERREIHQNFSPTIIITTEHLETNQIAISIEDNGCGIDEAIHSQIFDPFFTTKEIGEGKGLGLTLSYQVVVENHQGDLKFQSLLGKKTTFTIYLPIYKN